MEKTVNRPYAFLRLSTIISRARGARGSCEWPISGLIWRCAARRRHNPMTPLRSYLACRAASGIGPDDFARRDRLVAEAWRRDGLLVVSVADPALTWPERELIRALGERRFGQRYQVRRA